MQSRCSRAFAAFKHATFHTRLLHPAHRGAADYKEVGMLKVGMRPGEYITIGDDVKIVFSGGTGRHIHLLVEAPREKKILRSSYSDNDDRAPYYAEESLSKEHVRNLVRSQKRKEAAGN